MAGGLDEHWCKQADNGLIAPDAVLYLHMPVADTLTRQEFGKERFEQPDVQQTVKTMFEERLQPTVQVPWHSVSVADRTIAAVHETVWELVQNIKTSDALRTVCW